MNARSLVAVAALLACAAAGCAARSGTRTETIAATLDPNQTEFKVPGKDCVLQVEFGDARQLKGYRATCGDKNPEVRPLELSQLELCFREPPAIGERCQVLSLIEAEGKYIVSGDNSRCFIFLGGRLLYYEC